MSDIAIKVEGLGKRYRIGLKEEIEDSLAAVVSSWVASPIQNFKRLRKLSSFDEGDAADVLWALRDVSFEVPRGQVLGVIGRNGAGKSTLLKILSQITEPTEGRVELRGRVSSLLEVGTGFHAELTGRENVYLNGTVLGMTRAEVERKFDEIVAFSGVEKFIDTPVKRYSSGMRVRLAFAVAAHLEPEILLIDEVLAVGDASFQKKCLGKMEEMASHGRTVMFVSHDMAAVDHLCNRTMLLTDGEIEMVGETPDVISAYLAAVDTRARMPLAERSDRRGTGRMRFTEARLEVGGQPSTAWRAGEDVTLHLEYEVVDDDARRAPLSVHVGIDDELGVRIAHLSNDTLDQPLRVTDGRCGRVSIEISRLALMPGSYRLSLLSTVNGEIADWILSAIQVDIESGDYYETGKLPKKGHCRVLLEHRYDCAPVENST